MKEKKLKKAKKTKVGVKDESTEAAPKYTPGALSALFGLGPSSVEAAVPDEEQPWNSTPTGILTSRKKLQEAVKAEVKEEEEKQDEAMDEETKGDEEKLSAKESRKTQRDNRKKKTMTEDDKERTIFVGNVEKTVTEKTIKQHFAKYGPIESVRLRGVIPAKGNLSKKTAKLANKMSDHQKTVNFYVKFTETKSVDDALEENGTEQWGHRLRVDRCTKKGDLESKQSIFIGNLPFDTTEDALATRMETMIGPVEAVRIVRDPNTGQGKGFAFVAFKELASVALALSMPSIKFRKRELRVTKVQKKKNLRKMEQKKKTHGLSRSFKKPLPNPSKKFQGNRKGGNPKTIMN
ncbi:unnamed protein product, partial [Mesorhabditis belari]|uniref:RRM domain-containing protein n=1 Tax=Mesorhabditis belari TaxID=2138241 RepID=A0AAF3J5T6_9BILA